MVALIIETVDASGEVLEEALAPAQKVLRPHWAALPETIREMMNQLNTTARQPHTKEST